MLGQVRLTPSSARDGACQAGGLGASCAFSLATSSARDLTLELLQATTEQIGKEQEGLPFGLAIQGPRRNHAGSHISFFLSYQHESMQSQSGDPLNLLLA